MTKTREAHKTGERNKGWKMPAKPLDVWQVKCPLWQGFHVPMISAKAEVFCEKCGASWSDLDAQVNKR
jgi:hypothetical protein